MNPKFFEEKDFKSQPWKNGQGITLELFRFENPAEPQNFLFRLSRATLKASGPFSQYPGIDRSLIFIKGTHLLLTRENGETLKLDPLSIFSFRGEENIYGEVSSECLDFNVMTDRRWGKSEAEIIKLKSGQKLNIPSPSFLYQLEGMIKFDHKEYTGKLWQVDQRIEIDSLTDSISILVNIKLF